GKLSAHAKGFAFVTPDEFGQDDIFIPPNELGTAMNGDTVMVRVSHKSNGTQKDGTVIRILERNTQTGVGPSPATKSF
ncbi:ribonuclease R, partial [Bacillus altitudinis]|nr:ribonuclease R [Bacillus altitudinis]